MKYKAFNIEYESYGQRACLPKEIEIEVPNDCDDVMEFISDEISNKTGFSHSGFEYYYCATSAEIKKFLNSFCTKVRKNESSAHVELMMDNHKCIEFLKKQYYVPEENSSYSPTDELIYEHLIENYSL